MKVIMYMAITVNGFIAKQDDDTSWISREEWNSYSAAARKAGCLIIGRRTYHILTKQPEFSELKDVKLVVVSKEKVPELISPNHNVAFSPKEALNLLNDFKVVVVAGGGALNKSFAEQNLIDELYLDIEPFAFGNGIRLFSEGKFEKKLELLGVKNITKNELQLHYKVVK